MRDADEVRLRRLDPDSAPAQYHVLIADPRVGFAEALSALLRRSDVVVDHCAPEELLAMVQKTRCDLLLCDAGLSRSALAGDVREARRIHPRLRVVLLAHTMHDVYDPAAAQLGAVGWVGPDTTVDTLLDIVRRAHRPQAPHAAARSPRPRHANGSGGLVDLLTAREVEVLRALMTGGRNEAVAAQLGISPHTVRTHAQNILGKLDVRTRFEAAAVAREAGLRPLPNGSTAAAANHPGRP